MESSFYHFKALTHILNVNQIHVSSGEFKILLEAIQKGNLSEVKEGLSSLGKIVARIFEVEPLKAHQYYFVEWENQAVAVTSSADLLAELLKAFPEQPEIRICTEK
ncbi:hypothetical protein [Granulicatella elegans]|uniref:hypothetical protein n=1 Tax=Granulicatella elegans TaxID=137732 RepID=UPI0028D2C99B|nr:hypothetical protein [Granulicatella elegans]